MFDLNPLHHGTLGAVRSLGRHGVPVHLVQESRWLPAALSRYTTGRHTWPDGMTGPGDAVAALRTLAEKIGRRPVLLPVDDAGAIFISENGEALAPAFDFVRQRPGLARSLVDKYALARHCASLAVPHPRTVRPLTWDELACSDPPDGRWPVVLKRATPWGPASLRGLPSTRLVHRARELADLAETVRADPSDDPGLLLQEYVPAAPGQDYFFHGYYDENGNCLTGFTGVKDRSWPAYTGLTVHGRAEDAPAIRTQVDVLLRGIGFTGIVDVDLRRDPRSGACHVLDVNPRLGAQFRLFETFAGVDVVLAMHLHLTDRPVPVSPQVSGRTFLVENLEPATALRYRRDGHLDVARWWESVRGVDEFAWLAADDMLPFAAMVYRSTVEGFRRRAGLVRKGDGASRTLNEIVTDPSGIFQCGPSR
jgi:predicted ATP-grasp superfamily ATP-dependent carboligase